MRLLGKQLVDVESADLAGLVRDSVAESPELDYKQALPGKADSERKEFLADVAAMANTRGGVLIYGVEEGLDDQGRKTGVASALAGLDGINPADEELRLGQMIRAGLAPPLTSCLVLSISSPDTGKPIIAVGVPASLLAPHAVAFATTLPFWRRAGQAKYSVPIDELREMFLGRYEWEEDAIALRDQRLDRIQSGEFPRMPSGPLACVHVVPLGRRGQWVDLIRHQEALSQLFSFGSPYVRERRNLSGIAQERGSGTSVAAAVQWFRFGGVELCWSVDVGARNRDPQRQGINASKMSIYIAEYSKRAIEAIRGVLEVDPPYGVMVSVLGVAGIGIWWTSELVVDPFWEPQANEFEDRNLLLPPLLVSSEDQDIVTDLRPTLDAIWQAAGLPRCLLYDTDGRWKGLDMRGARDIL